MKMCGETHTNEDGDFLICVLPEHPLDVPHSDGDERWETE